MFCLSYLLIVDKKILKYCLTCKNSLSYISQDTMIVKLSIEL